MITDQCQRFATFYLRDCSAIQQMAFIGSVVLSGLLLVTLGMWLLFYVITREDVESGKSVGFADWLLAAGALFLSWLFLGAACIKILALYVGLRLVSYAAKRLGRPHFLPRFTHRIVEAFKRLMWY